MKRLLIVFFLIPVFAFAQPYGQFGISVFSSPTLKGNVGINGGFGFKTGSITTGVIYDHYALADDKPKFGILALDVRAYVDGLDKPVSPFIGAQPGWVVYTEDKGGFTIAAMAGVRAKANKLPGVVFAIGYQSVAFEGALNKRHSGFKVNLALFM